MSRRLIQPIEQCRASLLSPFIAWEENEVISSGHIWKFTGAAISRCLVGTGLVIQLTTYSHRPPVRRLRGPTGSRGERAVQEGVHRLGLGPTQKGSGKGPTESRVSWGDTAGGKECRGPASWSRTTEPERLNQALHGH